MCSARRFTCTRVDSRPRRRLHCLSSAAATVLLTACGCAGPAPAVETVPATAPPISAAPADDLRTGPFSVAHRGDELRVSIEGQCELKIARGALRTWRDARGRALSGDGGLGPWPLLAEADWPARPESAALRLADEHADPPGVVTEQVLLEASPLRVVIETRRRPARDPAQADVAAASTAREHIWRYVLYADGRLFVRVVSQYADELPAGRQLCHGLILDSRRGFERVPPPPASPEYQPAPFTMLAAPDPARAALLWVPHAPPAAAQRRLVPLDGRQQLIALVKAAAADSAGLLWFRHAAPADGATAESIAADYQNPVSLRPASGRVRTDVPGDLNSDGYNESEGCYELEMEHGRLSCEFDPDARPRWAPIMRIHGSAQLRCWAYLDGAVAETHRDGQDRLMLMLPGVIRGPRIVEVYAEPSAAAPDRELPSGSAQPRSGRPSSPGPGFWAAGGAARSRPPAD